MIIKKEVAVCDVCKDRLAESIKKGKGRKYLKCEICENHVCDECYFNKDIYLEEDEVNTILVCEDCRDKLPKIKDKGNEIKKHFIEELKKGVILKSL